MPGIVEEVWIGAADFEPLLAPKTLVPSPVFERRPPRWQLPRAMRPTDGLSVEIQTRAGDRILTLAPDIDIEQGYLELELFERRADRTISLLRLENQDPAARPNGRPAAEYSVRRMVGEGSLILAVYSGNTEIGAYNRYVNGAAIRIARAA